MSNMYQSKIDKNETTSTFVWCPCKGGCTTGCGGTCKKGCWGNCAGYCSGEEGEIVYN